MLTGGLGTFPFFMLFNCAHKFFPTKPFAPVTNIFMYEISKILTNQSIMMNHTSRSLHMPPARERLRRPG